jgi:hypothetical protein
MSRSARVGLNLAIAITVVGAVAVPITGAHAAPAQSTSFSASEVGTIAPSHAARPTPAAKRAAVTQRGNRGLGKHAPSSNAPSAPTVNPSNTHSTATVTSNFDGTSSRDSQIANFNLEFEPPDQGLCVGNGYVVEPVNSAFRIFNTSGNTLAGPSNVNDLYNEGALQFTSDPRCYYDATTNTWFATILFIATNNGAFGTTSHLDIAVNPTGNPMNVWTEYQFDTTDKTNKGCNAHLGGCFGDQPKLGIDQNNVYVSTDEFGITSNTYNGAQIFAFSKSDLIAGGSVHYALFKNLKNADGSIAGPLQPAITTGTPSAEYFMDALDPNGTGDNRIGVWALTNGAAVSSGKAPTLSTIIANSEPYAIPPDAAQKGSTSTITNNLDDRMQQTQYINGTIWGELDTAITISGDSATRSAGAWFAVTPTLSHGVISSASVNRQGYVAQKGNYVMYPALQVASSGNAAMVFTLSGSTIYPSAAYSWLSAGSSNFSAPQVAASGTGPYDPNGTRWGDYSWAVIDPTADAFWLATEYIPPVGSQTTDGALNWGTRVFEVSAG